MISPGICTTIKSKKSGEPCKTHRLVESERVDGKVEQRTLLNLGRHFDVPKSQWQALSQRIAALLDSQQGCLLPECELEEALEALAQRHAAQILARRQVERGRSREKRSDCPLVTLGLVLDGSGFVRQSEIFAGNASEPQTLATMLTGLGVGANSTVVMDAGIASEENIVYLVEKGYRYLVVSRKRHRDFDVTQATVVKEAPGQNVKVQRVVDDETGEVRLYCHSERREKKEQAMQDQARERFESALQTLSAACTRKAPPSVMTRCSNASVVTRKIGSMGISSSPCWPTIWCIPCAPS